MNRTKTILLAIVFMLSLSHAYAAESTKVVVIPLGSSSDNVPGDIKTISVSSLAGATSGADIYRVSTCGSSGMRASSGTNAFINVPVQLPDNATVTSFSGLFCLNKTGVVITMQLMRSDGTSLGSKNGSTTSASTTPQRRTDATINAPLVDNSNYAYYISMGLKGDLGNDIYPISAHITLE